MTTDWSNVTVGDLIEKAVQERLKDLTHRHDNVMHVLSDGAQEWIVEFGAEHAYSAYRQAQLQEFGDDLRPWNRLSTDDQIVWNHVAAVVIECFIETVREFDL